MECYICYDKETNSNKFCNYQPCKCKGSIAIHESCLEKLINHCNNRCTICNSIFKRNTSSKLNIKTNDISLTYYQKQILNIEFNYIFRDDPEMLAYAKQISMIDEYERPLIRALDQPTKKCSCVIS